MEAYEEAIELADLGKIDYSLIFGGGAGGTAAAMADEPGWRWSEFLSMLAGTGIGFAVGGPTGAMAGANIGAGLNPGGFWEPTASELPGRSALGGDIEKAAQQEMGAIRMDVGRQLVQALKRSDVRMAQRGFLRSGEAESARGEFEQAASRDIAAASARIQLEKLGLLTQAQTAQQRYDLQLAQLETQKQAAESALWSQIGMMAIKYALSRSGSPTGGDVGMVNNLEAGGTTYTNPGLTETWAGYKNG